ncbi:glycosyltransferase family 1 protein [Bacillus sp. JJ1764]|uniref:glycosyltransferase family 1 protein n=1 Tax=Bacillus sp. JJ1764 TaxID=3122964 RepID=UPI002FFF173A
MNNEPKRILHIVSSMQRGGAETLIMNIYRNINRDKIQFDFITHSLVKGDFDDEIQQLGGHIYHIRSLGQLGPIQYIKELLRVMKMYPFAAVHAHTDYQSGFPALAAKLSGIPKRICHSHSTNWQRGASNKEKITLKLLQSCIRFSATHYCCCSEEAGSFLFGRELINRGKVKILNNGIDPSEFVRSINDRQQIIKELNLSKDAKIIGHVGRFSESKNHIFLLQVLKKLTEQDSSYVALLIGDGPLRKEVEEEAGRMGLLKNIRFLGVRADISRFMNAFDLFLFPSKFEGFGIVTIEAQCSGTPCIISDTVPKSTDMGLDLTTYISLEESLDHWCFKIKEALMSTKPDSDLIVQQIDKRGYSIKENVKEWNDLYGA